MDKLQINHGKKIKKFIISLNILYKLINTNHEFMNKLNSKYFYKPVFKILRIQLKFPIERK